MLDDNVLPLVSVVIPVYKTEKYLDECIASVLGQAYQNIEVILVDDGGSNICSDICENYAGRYDKIQVIHQENQGAGAARNRGMESASGKYVLFLDSDDCLDGKSAVMRLVEKAEEDLADIVTGNFRRFNASGMSKINRHHLRSGSYARTVDFRFKGFLTENHLISDWGKLYRTAFLKKSRIKHAEYRIMEDKLYNMMCCACGPVYGFIHESVYLYRITEGSATDQYKENVEELTEAWLRVAERFWDFLKGKKLQDAYGDLLAFHLLCGLFTIGRKSLQSSGMSGYGIKTAVKLLKSYGMHPLVREMVTALSRGEYVKDVQSFFWKILVRAASVLFCMNAYRILVCGIAIFNGLSIEKRMGRLKYQHTICGSKSIKTCERQERL